MGYGESQLGRVHGDVYPDRMGGGDWSGQGAGDSGGDYVWVVGVYCAVAGVWAEVEEVAGKDVFRESKGVRRCRWVDAIPVLQVRNERFI